MLDTEPRKKREILIAVAYICVTYGYAMQGYKGFWVDLHHIIDGIPHFAVGTQPP